MSDEKKFDAEFELLSSAQPFEMSKNVYYVSKQKITQKKDGSSTNHLVIKKQAISLDKSPNGSAKQLFIPEDDAVEVLKHALGFAKS